MKKKMSLLLSIIFIATIMIPNVVVFAHVDNNTKVEQKSKDYKDMSQEELDACINELFDNANSDSLTIEYNANKESNNKSVFRGGYYRGGDRVRLTIEKDSYIMFCDNETTGAVYACNYRNSYAGYNCGTRNTIGCCQGLMNCNGYALAVDGIFGPNTYNAVVDFQRKRNLAVDGIAGPKTFSIALLLAFKDGDYI